MSPSFAATHEPVLLFFSLFPHYKHMQSYPRTNSTLLNVPFTFKDKINDSQNETCIHWMYRKRVWFDDAACPTEPHASDTRLLFSHFWYETGLTRLFLSWKWQRLHCPAEEEVWPQRVTSAYLGHRGFAPGRWHLHKTTREQRRHRHHGTLNQRGQLTLQPLSSSITSAPPVCPNTWRPGTWPTTPLRQWPGRSWTITPPVADW